MRICCPRPCERFHPLRPPETRNENPVRTEKYSRRPTQNSRKRGLRNHRRWCSSAPRSYYPRAEPSGASAATAITRINEPVNPSVVTFQNVSTRLEHHISGVRVGISDFPCSTLPWRSRSSHPNDRRRRSHRIRSGSLRGFTPVYTPFSSDGSAASEILYSRKRANGRVPNPCQVIPPSALRNTVSVLSEFGWRDKSGASLPG